MARGNMTHGSKSKRQHGSIGMCATPARVFPGLKMAGHMGNKRIKTRKLKVQHPGPFHKSRSNRHLKHQPAHERHGKTSRPLTREGSRGKTQSLWRRRLGSRATGRNQLLSSADPHLQSGVQLIHSLLLSAVALAAAASGKHSLLLIGPCAS